MGTPGVGEAVRIQLSQDLALWKELVGELGRVWCDCLHTHSLPFSLFQLHRLNWFRAAKLNEERYDQSNIS